MAASRTDACEAWPPGTVFVSARAAVEGSDCPSGEVEAVVACGALALDLASEMLGLESLT